MESAAKKIEGSTSFRGVSLNPSDKSAYSSRCGSADRSNHQRLGAGGMGQHSPPAPTLISCMPVNLCRQTKGLESVALALMQT